MKPILFNTEMVRANLDGRKGTTRRLIKPQPRGHAALVNRNLLPETIEAGAGAVYAFEDGTVVAEPFQVGDVLYVRETWGRTAEFPGISEGGVIYAADYSDMELLYYKDKHFRWRPSIHMPKEYARLFLRVTDVWAERLQQITADGCAMEGVWPLYSGPIGGREEYYKDKFSYIWDSTIPKGERDTYGWDANPWVWVIQYEQCDKPKEV